MARLPRLVVPGQAHYVIQRGHSAGTVFVDDEDRHCYLAALREAAMAHQLVLHGYALCDDEVPLLATPPDAEALSRSLQALGRRYVSAYNRRHACRGTLWDGRFRCGVVEPGRARLAALLLVDGAAGQTSATQRCGGPREPWLVDSAEVWGLGNTPFDRELAWKQLLAQGVPAAQARALREAALGGWAIGSPGFVAEMAAQARRPAAKRPRGRPARNVGA
jgi:putative transposase